MDITLCNRSSPSLHDFYRGETQVLSQMDCQRHASGRGNCLHDCLYCYARDAVYSRKKEGAMLDAFRPGLHRGEGADRAGAVPPVSISNATDPCQDVPELRQAVKDLVGVLVTWGVSFHVITKGDPSFLAEVDGFPAGAFLPGRDHRGAAERCWACSRGPVLQKRLASCAGASLGLPPWCLDPVVPPCGVPSTARTEEAASLVVADCAACGSRARGEFHRAFHRCHQGRPPGLVRDGGGSKGTAWKSATSTTALYLQRLHAPPRPAPSLPPPHA